jgi:hypothetical protein
MKKNHGGKRKNAGRKKKKKSEKSITGSISMSRQSWDKLDRARGTEPRGKFIAALLT